MAFPKWQEQQLQLEALGKQTTWQMYRRKLKVLNRNKLIVFVGQHFGIFPSHEVFMLANVPVHKTEEELNINREQIYAKYINGPVTENSWSGRLRVLLNIIVSRFILISEFQFLVALIAVFC